VALTAGGSAMFIPSIVMVLVLSHKILLARCQTVSRSEAERNPEVSDIGKHSPMRQFVIASTTCRNAS
jgi:hypothetical protein